ncbi:MAG: branched-chain amino acid ABC transporter permease [Burkholderiales bacterium]|nr:branched-chain amino acid ABC transporter permease [Burkholderiales bacterium]
MALVLNGLSISMLLFLLAAGLTLVFGLLGVVNFAHGSLYMLGAYVAYQLVHWSGNFWLALLVAPLVVGLVGALMERFALRPLYARDHSYQLLLTFGFILVIEEFIRMVWGVDFRTVNPPPLLTGTTEVGGSVVTNYRLFIIAFGAAVSALLFYVIEKTRVGVVVRAASANSAMVACLGIDVGKVRTGVFVAGAMLAAISGVIAAPLLPLKLGMSFSIIIDCFIIVVIGGQGSIRGAIVGALLIGMTRALGQVYATELMLLATYALLILTLIIRPEGLFGVRRRRA